MQIFRDDYFTVQLPLATETPTDFEPHDALPAPNCSPLRVLLVEDNPANQKLAAYLLQERGHAVEIACDGQEAIRLTEQDCYDVILMDIQMPGMNGLEATVAIRQREGDGCRVPIIAMTAHAMKTDRERCLAAGMDGYLAKPVNAQEMIGLVESLACGAKPVSQVAVPNPMQKPARAMNLLFDPDAAVRRCFNSREMVLEMIQHFHDEVSGLFSQMRVALQNGDLLEVGRLGHRVKGTLVYLAAGRAEEAALRVEQFFHKPSDGAAEAEEAIHALERECIALTAELAGHVLTAKTAPSSVSGEPIS